MARVVVLGGGPAGLAAAWKAAEAGHEVVLLERSARAGGAAASTSVDGIRVDHGSHRLHAATPPPVLADLRQLLGADLQRRQRRGRIRLEGRWVGFPLRAIDLARHLPRGFVAAAARDAVLAPLRREREDSYAEVLRAGLGPTMLDRFYGPYARKLWGLEPDQIAGEQARRRVGARSPAALANRVLRRGQPGFFYYPRTGFGAIAEALGRAAAGAGADLRFGISAEAVRLHDTGVQVGAGGGTVRGDVLLSTIPLPLLARLAEAEPTVLEAAAGLRSRAMVLVHLALEGRPYTPFDAHYLPGPETPVTRISEPTNYRDGDDPPDRTVLTAELPCAQGDATWTAQPEALRDLVLAALEGACLPRPVVRTAAVRRLPQAYPVVDRSAPARLAAVERWAQSAPRLLSFGRQGLFAHDNTHHALATAYEAVGALGPGGQVDAERWAEARAGFRAHVVED